MATASGGMSGSGMTSDRTRARMVERLRNDGIRDELVLSAMNWMLIGSVMWVLLQHRVDYPSVLGVLLIAAVAGVIAHVPAGLGVLEAVFVALLSGRVPQGELLAALLAYRATYYLAPLALALGLFIKLEVGAKRSRRPLIGSSC